ncbi:MAG: bifunctional 2-polyprenyl-6-hydroxyphenol methylase/3-demethylubiquinol 3-O-methyltransferase UbiG [Arenicellales bacterium]
MKPNVDPTEIAKFSEIASRWWDPNSEFRPLHQINPLRLSYIEQHGKLAGLDVIDVGCGGGILSEAMAVSGANVTGIDLGEKALSVAKLHALESGQKIDYRLISAEEMAEESAAKFDVVTCLEMLEHVPDPASIVAACAKLVKPGGRVYFSTLNRTPKAYAMAVIGAEYILNLLPRGTHEYQKFIKPSELHGWAETSELTMHDLIGMHYNPIFKSYKLAPGIDVNYLAHCTKA